MAGFKLKQKTGNSSERTGRGSANGSTRILPKRRNRSGLRKAVSGSSGDEDDSSTN